MDILKIIDNNLSQHLDQLHEYSKTLSFHPICVFKLADNGVETVPFNTFSFAGLYLIEIKCDPTTSSYLEWVNKFQKDWTNEKYKHKFVANPKKVRVESHEELKQWMPLYIGKSKKICSRVREHIYLGLDKPTFALKLLAREQLSQNEFRVSIIELPVKHYNWIVPVLEQKMRDRLNPIIGRQ